MRNVEENVKRQLDVKKTIIVILVGIILLCLIVLIILYFTREDFRKWTDTTILRKNLVSEDVRTIDLNIDKNNQIYCYSKYISILNDKNLKIYNQNGENISELPININTAIFTSTDKYLAIAEKNGQEFCVIFDKTYLWSGKVEGEILQININKNGYVVLVTTDTTFKSIITIFDSTGNELIKRYLSKTRIVDVSLSNDNKYAAFAELDTSGALIQSNIEILSIDKAIQNEKEAIVYTYNANTAKMIVKIKYQTKGNLVCVYDDSVDIINNNNNEEVFTIDKKITFTSAELKENIVYITEEQTGLFSSTSTATIVDTSSNHKTYFNFDEVTKELYTKNDIIGINIGSEIYFVNTNGLLIKKYISSQEITNVNIADNFAIIIYKDRIEIIKL